MLTATLSDTEDADGDGLVDSVEGSGDADGDGIANYLDPDADNDGIYDVDEGTFDSFFTLSVDTDLVEDISATLPPGRQVDNSYLDDAFQNDLTLSEDAAVDVTFVDEGAGYQNSLGYYAFPEGTFDSLSKSDVDTNGDGTVSIAELLTVPNVEVGWIFPNSSKYYSGGNLLTGHSVNLRNGAQFSAGTTIGFLLVQNGWQGGYPGGTIKTTNQYGVASQVMYTTDHLNPEADADANDATDSGTNLSRHVALLYSDTDRDEIIMGFEDLNREDYTSNVMGMPASDNDFNDTIFIVRASPASALSGASIGVANSSTNPDADNDGVPDASELDEDSDGVMNINDPDDDGDGIVTSLESTDDSDGDGLPDYLDNDSTESDSGDSGDSANTDSGDSDSGDGGDVDGLGKVLFVGDSITEGWAARPAGEGNWSWRYGFWKHLVDHSIAHEFVGTQSDNYGGSSVYPDYEGQIFVNRHDAHWGLGAGHVASMLPNSLATLMSQNETPDTAVVYLGGNDIGFDSSVSAETVRNRIKEIIDVLQGDSGVSGNSNIRILVVSILPRFTLDSGGNYTVPFAANSHYTSINALLETLVVEETTDNSEVSYLDLATAFTNTADVFYDGVHPNDTGEQLEADAIFTALVDVSGSDSDSGDSGSTDSGDTGSTGAGDSGSDSSDTGNTDSGDSGSSSDDSGSSVSASISATVSQSGHGITGSTPIDLTAEGDLDWGVFASSFLSPSTGMSDGAGLSSMTYVGGAADDPSTIFNSQNSYTWSNGDTPVSGSNTDTTNAIFSSIGDGIRMNFDVSVAGTYQLKFYATTYDVNLDASISLSSGGVSETVAGSYANNQLQRYEYTIDFTTDGADTVTLDVTKSAGGSYIVAYEAFSLSLVSEASDSGSNQANDNGSTDSGGSGGGSDGGVSSDTGDSSTSGTPSISSTTKAQVQNYTGAPLDSGDRIDYTITLNNSGDGSTSDLSIQGLIPDNTSYVAGTLTVDGFSTAGDLDLNTTMGLGALAAGESAVIELQVEVDYGLPADAAWITSTVIINHDDSSDSVVSDNDTSGHCGINDDGFDHPLDTGVYTNDDDATKLPLMQATQFESCILAFEDLKNRGWNDWDMNDLVLRIASYYTLDSNNDVEAVFVTHHVLARGAGSDSQLNLTLPHGGFAEWQTLYLSNEGHTENVATGTNDSSTLTVRLWDSSKDALPPYTGLKHKWGAARTERFDPSNPGKRAVLNLYLDSPSANPLNTFSESPHDTWILVDTQETIHRLEYDLSSSQMVLEGPLFGRSMPFALKFDTDFTWPAEKQPIWLSHPNYVDYVKSGGTTNQDWADDIDIWRVWFDDEGAIPGRDAVNPAATSEVYGNYVEFWSNFN